GEVVREGLESGIRSPLFQASLIGDRGGRLWSFRPAAHLGAVGLRLAGARSDTVLQVGEVAGGCLADVDRGPQVLEREPLELGVEVGVLGDRPRSLVAVFAGQADGGPAKLHDDLFETVGAGSRSSMVTSSSCSSWLNGPVEDG